MTEKKVIELLRSYRAYAYEIEALDLSLRQLRSSAVMPGKGLDGMPHGGGPQDLSGYAAKIDKAERRLEEKKREAHKARDRVENAIEKLKDPDERTALRYHYILGVPWYKAAAKMHVSDATVYRLRKQAVAKLTHVLRG